MNYIKFSKGELAMMHELISQNPILREIDFDKKVYLNFDTADVIREWAVEALQKSGFDIDYNVTTNGRILEDIIDKLDY